MHPSPGGRERNGGSAQPQRADSPIAGWAGTQRGLRPRTPVLIDGGYAPPDLGAYQWGLPSPKPRVTFGRPKVTKRRWGDPRPPLFV